MSKRVDAIISPVDASSGSDKHTPWPAIMMSRMYADAAKVNLQLNPVAFALAKQEKINYQTSK